MSLIDVTVEDGKYTIRETAPHKWECLRYGEPWPAFEGTGPDNLHMALAREVERLRDQIEQLGYDHEEALAGLGGDL